MPAGWPGSGPASPEKLKWRPFCGLPRSEKYKEESAQWKELKPSSKEIYNRRLDYLQSRYGAADLATFTEKGVRRIRNNFTDRPSVADATVDMIGRLWRYAKEHLEMEDIGANPAAEVATIGRKNT